MRAGLSEMYGPRIVVWLRDVAREARAGGLTICLPHDGPEADAEGVQAEGSTAMFPVSEPAWKLTLSTRRRTGRVTVQVRAFSEDDQPDGNETFELLVYRGEHFANIAPDATMTVRPFRPAAWSGGPERRLAEVLVVPKDVARACARTLINEELARGVRPPILKLASVVLLLAPYLLLWQISTAQVMFGFLLGGAAMVWFTGLESLGEDRWRKRQLARFDA